MVAIMARDQIVKVVLDEQELRALDSLRVGVPRSVWLRDLLRTAATAARALEETQAPAEGGTVSRPDGSKTTPASPPTRMERAEASRARMERASRLSQGHGR
jgi:hypothetical protein